MNEDCPIIKIYQNGVLLAEMEFFGCLYCDLILHKCGQITAPGITVDWYSHFGNFTNIFQR